MNQINSRLTSLRLSGMSQCWKTLSETHKLNELSLADGMEMLLQSEEDQRSANRYARLLKNANFRYKASVEELNVEATRGIDKSLINRLAMGNYITNGEAILVTGSAGCGKSFLASALGYRACLQGNTVAYFNMQKLMMKLKMARLEGTIIKQFDKLANTDLLILDDFGIQPFDSQGRMNLMDIIEDRHGKKSTVITSQVPVRDWYDVIGEKTIADAVLDRIVHQAIRIELFGESLRKCKSKKDNCK